MCAGSSRLWKAAPAPTPVGLPRWIPCPPRRLHEKLADWRKHAPIRPVVFEDPRTLTDETVHLHLEQRVAQRLLARFRAQGFVYKDLSRACLAQSRDSIPRVVLLGRLALYGKGAERLHEELVPVTARWIEPSRRNGPLRAYARDTETRTLALLDEALTRQAEQPDAVVRETVVERRARRRGSAAPAVGATRQGAGGGRPRPARPARQGRGRAACQRAAPQRDRVIEELDRHEQNRQLALRFDAKETEQLEADKRHWRRRLAQFDQDLAQEPKRIESFYEVRARRVEPVGLVYLWPETN